MKGDEALREVAEIRRLHATDSQKIVRNESRARELGGQLNADVVIWGQNLCIGDSVCVYAKALFKHSARTTATIEQGVLHQGQVLRADLPTLVGARVPVLIRFIIGWTYLNDNRHTQYQKAFDYLSQALAQSDAEDRLRILIWNANAGLQSRFL